MKITLLAAVAALSLVSVAARAEGGEGNGDPFAFRAAGVVTTFAAPAATQARLPAPASAARQTAEAPRSMKVGQP